MSRLTRLVPLFALAAAVAWLPPADPARGCAIAPPLGERMDISAESAVIVWDESTKTEHFIRRARFAGTSADFGFLVPTPTEPELHEAGDTMFRVLETLTAPRVVYETRPRNQIACAAEEHPAADRVMSPAAPGGVEVLKQQQVGQFDAAVLRAEDPQKLRDWLDKHGYQARPELVEWLKAYTDNKWVITAFKIAGQTGEADPPDAKRNVDATAVRMTFKADRPFYPYREPEDMQTAPGGDRLLRVYFFAEHRYAGTLGADDHWPGRAVWANAAAVPLIEGVTFVPGRTWWLTEFEDRSSPRPGTDEVYFAPSADQSTLERPPIVRTTYVTQQWPNPWLVAAVCAVIPLAAIVSVYLVWRLALRRRA